MSPMSGDPKTEYLNSRIRIASDLERAECGIEQLTLKISRGSLARAKFMEATYFLGAIISSTEIINNLFEDHIKYGLGATAVSAACMLAGIRQREVVDERSIPVKEYDRVHHILTIDFRDSL